MLPAVVVESPKSDGRLSFADMVVDLDGHTLEDAGGRDVRLTAGEFALLAAFLRAPGRALSRDHLLQAVAGRDADAFDRSIDVLVGRLRRKIEPDPRTPRLIVTVAGVGYRFTPRPTRASGLAMQADRPSLAVLPFTNMSGSAEQDYFADGMVEEITTALGRVRWFFVIARNSSFTYKGRAVDVKQVGRELGVRYVLEGSVRRAGERVRIAVQLAETETGVHVWADRFEGVIDDIFDLQNSITASVVGAIEPHLRDAELRRSKRQRPKDPTAYDCFLRGFAKYYAESREDNDATMALLRRAIASDPEFAPPYGLAAACCIYRIGQGWSADPRQDRQLGIEMARTAARLGSGDAMVLALAGHSLGYLTDEYELSLALTDQALALNPNCATALQVGGWARLFAGDPETAIAYLLRGARLNPIDTRRFILNSGMAYACLMLGRAAEAVDWATKALREAPLWIFTAVPLAGALALLGRADEARAAVALLLQHIPRHSVAREARIFRPGPARDRLADAMTRAGMPP